MIIKALEQLQAHQQSLLASDLEQQKAIANSQYPRSHRIYLAEEDELMSFVPQANDKTHSPDGISKTVNKTKRNYVKILCCQF